MHALKALVTGHSRGLGAAVTEAFLQRGVPVLACARQENADLATRFPELLRQQQIDLGDTAALAAWLDGEALDPFCADAGTLILINNAGVLGPVGSLDSQNPAAIGQAVALNVGAPLMLAAALAQRHAGELRILHSSSGAARFAYPGWSIYGSTKAALDQHARAVAAGNRDDRRICSLAPGVIDTDMQTEIRSLPETSFPMLKKFQKLKRNGLLTPPTEAAARIVEYVLDPDFGSLATADLRELISGE